MITKIKDNIFTGAYVDLESARKEFSENQVIDVRDLVDKYGNEISNIVSYAKKAESAYLKFGKVIVVCDMGISRSRAVTITLLHLLGMSVEEAIDHVMSVCGMPAISPDLINLIRQGLTKTKNVASYDNSKIVLGSKGFVGSHITDFYRYSGFKVHEFHRANHDLGNLFSLMKAFDDLPSRDVIFAINNKSFHSNDEFGSALQLLKNVLEACRFSKKRLVFLSSGVVYLGNARQSSKLDFWADEQQKPFPYGVYSETKSLSEELIRIYALNYDLEYLILRPSGLYGMGMRPQWLVNRLIQKALNHEEIITHEYTNGLPKFDFLHIKDFLKAMSLILSSENSAANSNRMFNIGGGSLISTKDLAMKIVDVTSSKSIVSTKKIASDVYNVGFREGAINATGWGPLINLDAGLREIVGSTSV